MIHPPPKGPDGARLKAPSLDPVIAYQATMGRLPIDEHSRYFAVEHEDKVYHVYNAARYVSGLEAW